MISFKPNDVPKASPPDVVTPDIRALAYGFGGHRYSVHNSKHSLCPLLDCWLPSHWQRGLARMRNTLQRKPHTPCSVCDVKAQEDPRRQQIHNRQTPNGPWMYRLLISDKEALGHLLRNKPEAQRLPHQPLPPTARGRQAPFCPS